MAINEEHKINPCNCLRKCLRGTKIKDDDNFNMTVT